MAEGTSFAFPTPNPTTPWPSPTTTSALKLRFLPPLTTFVTRLMETTVSLISSCDGSIFSRVRFIAMCFSQLELETGLARGVGHGLDAPMIEEAVPVENHLLDALLEEPLRDGPADHFGAGNVAAPRVLHRPFLRRCQRRGGRDRPAAHIVDHLHVHVRDAPEHGEPRAALVAQHPLPDTVLDPQAAIVLRLDAHCRSLSPVRRRSCRPSSSAVRPCSGRPSACTGRVSAGGGCWRPPVQPAAGRRRSP